MIIRNKKRLFDEYGEDKEELSKLVRPGERKMR